MSRGRKLSPRACLRKPSGGSCTRVLAHLTRAHTFIHIPDHTTSYATHTYTHTYLSQTQHTHVHTPSYMHSPDGLHRNWSPAGRHFLPQHAWTWEREVSDNNRGRPGMTGRARGHWAAGEGADRAHHPPRPAPPGAGGTASTDLRGSSLLSGLLAPRDSLPVGGALKEAPRSHAQPSPLERLLVTLPNPTSLWKGGVPHTEELSALPRSDDGEASTRTRSGPNASVPGRRALPEAAR